MPSLLVSLSDHWILCWDVYCGCVSFHLCNLFFFSNTSLGVYFIVNDLGGYLKYVSVWLSSCICAWLYLKENHRILCTVDNKAIFILCQNADGRAAMVRHSIPLLVLVVRTPSIIANTDTDTVYKCSGKSPLSSHKTTLNR